MNFTTEKKGKRAMLWTSLIFVCGLVQSLSTEFLADAIVKLMINDSFGAEAQIVRIILFLVLSFGLYLLLEQFTKGVFKTDYVPYGLGSIIALFGYELATELIDNLTNTSIWYWLDTLMSINGVGVYVMGLLFSIVLFGIMGYCMAFLTKLKEGAVGVASNDKEAKAHYYYSSVWFMAYLCMLALCIIIYIVLSEKLPIWSNYGYWL